MVVLGEHVHEKALNRKVGLEPRTLGSLSIIDYIKETKHLFDFGTGFYFGLLESQGHQFDPTFKYSMLVMPSVITLSKDALTAKFSKLESQGIRDDCERSNTALGSEGSNLCRALEFRASAIIQTAPYVAFNTALKTTVGYIAGYCLGKLSN